MDKPEKSKSSFWKERKSKVEKSKYAFWKYMLVMPASRYYVAKNGPDLLTPRAYNMAGQLIGTHEQAASFAMQHIFPEYADPTSTLCQVGYCSKIAKWYGWTTSFKKNIMAGFWIGDSTESVVAALDNNGLKWSSVSLPSGYVAHRPEEARLLAVAFVRAAESISFSR